MVIFSEKAKSLLRASDRHTRKLVGSEIRKFQDGGSVDLKKLKGEGDTWRISAGGWRVLMEARQGEGEKIFEVVYSAA